MHNSNNVLMRLKVTSAYYIFDVQYIYIPTVCYAQSSIIIFPNLLLSLLQPHFQESGLCTSQVLL